MNFPFLLKKTTQKIFLIKIFIFMVVLIFLPIFQASAQVFEAFYFPLLIFHLLLQRRIPKLLKINLIVNLINQVLDYFLQFYKCK